MSEYFKLFKTSLDMFVKWYFSMFVESYQFVSDIASIRIGGFENSRQSIHTRETCLDMFIESHQFVSEVLEIQDKFLHVCRIVSIHIRKTCLDMFDESHHICIGDLEIQDKFQHVCRIVSICIM